jgi:hypothetical protein
MNFIRNLIGKVSSKVASSSSTAAPATSGSALLAKQRLAAVILDQRGAHALMMYIVMLYDIPRAPYFSRFFGGRK